MQGGRCPSLPSCAHHHSCTAAPQPAANSHLQRRRPRLPPPRNTQTPALPPPPPPTQTHTCASSSRAILATCDSSTITHLSPARQSFFKNVSVSSSSRADAFLASRLVPRILAPACGFRAEAAAASEAEGAANGPPCALRSSSHRRWRQLTILGESEIVLAEFRVWHWLRRGLDEGCCRCCWCCHRRRCRGVCRRRRCGGHRASSGCSFLSCLATCLYTYVTVSRCLWAGGRIDCAAVSVGYGAGSSGSAGRVPCTLLRGLR